MGLMTLFLLAALLAASAWQVGFYTQGYFNESMEYLFGVSAPKHAPVAPPPAPNLN